MQLNIFRIPAHSSSTEVREYDFELNDSFFAHFEYGEIEKGSLTASLGVIYSSRQVQINLSIKGMVLLQCDRCLDSYEEVIDARYVLFGKYGNLVDQDDLDVFWIPEDRNYIDLVPFLFDYINLSLPLKKIHPADENGESLCNEDMISRLRKLGINIDE